MNRRVVVTVAIAAVLGGAITVRLSPEWRTKSYFALERAWRTHWHLSRGQWLPWRVRPLFEPFVSVLLELEPGVRLLLDPSDTLGRSILETGNYEPGSWDTLQRHLPPGGVFVDIGAHIGYYSLKAAHQVGSTGRVISIEPNPPTVKRLRENIAASGAAGVLVEPVACADSEGTLDLFSSAGSHTAGTSLSRENALESGSIGVVHRVRTRTLDDIIRETGVTRVDAIKIDVEGAQLIVIKGARQTLTKYSPFLVVELIDRHLKAMGTSAAEVTELLHSLGYTPRRTLGPDVEFSK